MSLIVKMKDGSSLKIKGCTMDLTHTGGIGVTAEDGDTTVIAAVLPWHNVASIHDPECVEFTPRSHRRKK